ncbi:multicomponent Na+:H+ antiporter subunit D [Orenia metallireducens]|jgi:proton-translocating NADH-quinone oxidoreductase chain N|uniref:Multicomponent Na+:H+ antiporter subunit D n=1 Tax=Orenia metallireducens TaxID=1413210 RepID=A0A285HPM9_9FIRM|nr:proton-conducting transporter membrane subunit [Orenia metallireducens]PRX27953.1 multicomponent Na+:H+ antiporter subunit D [Orenia metallireducens]SNY37689.1 multicomponent Na+:H+ antiporter subunit D [Orenia metallireducens]
MDRVIWLIILPLLTAFSLGLLKLYFKRYFNYIIIISSTVHIILAFVVANQAIKEPIVYNLGNWSPLLGITLVIDSFSALFLLAIVTLAYLVTIYAIKFIKRDKLKYHTLSLLLLTGAIGIVITGDLFNLYVFFEIVSISSYALAAINKDKESFEGAFKYLILGSISGILILLAIILIYQSTGTLNLAQAAVKFKEVPRNLKVTILTFYLIGFASKFALVPLHSYLADVYSKASVTFTALSSGIVLKTSLYALIRIVYILFGVEFIIDSGLQDILIYWGTLTFIAAHLLAYQQNSLRRLLGYSSIAHMGYIIMAFALANKGGIIAGSYHLTNHIVMKGALFLATGIFIYNLKDDQISKLKGIGKTLPYSSLIFTIAALAIIGLPPFNGFVSKWLIIKQVLEANYSIPAFLILIGSLLSLIYYLRVIKELYSKANDDKSLVKEPLILKLPALTLGLFCLLLSLLPSFAPKLLETLPEFLIKQNNYINLLLRR